MNDNNRIPKIDKLNYLNSLLDEAAAKMVQDLMLTKANYYSSMKLF